MSQSSFDLNAALTEWRRQMVGGGIKKTADLDELESHLHEDIDKLIESGLSDSQAFVLATQRIGQPALLKCEFKKVEQQRKYRFREFILFLSAGALALAATEKTDVTARFVLGFLVVSYVQFAFIKNGILNHAKLLRIRPYALVGNFVIAAMLTGSGIIVQALMALALQLNYEVDVRFTRHQERRLNPARD